MKMQARKLRPYIAERPVGIVWILCCDTGSKPNGFSVTTFIWLEFSVAVRASIVAPLRACGRVALNLGSSSEIALWVVRRYQAPDPTVNHKRVGGIWGS